MSRARKNFIQEMGMKKGALHKSLHVPQGEKIPAKKLNKAAHSSNPTLRKRAVLAKTLKKLPHKMDGGMMNANNNQMPTNNLPNQYSAASQVPRPTQGVQPKSNNPWANPALNGLRSQQPQQPMNQGNNPSWMQNPNLAQQMNMPIGNKYKKGGRAQKKAMGGSFFGDIFKRAKQSPGGFMGMLRPQPSGQAGNLGRQEQFDWDKANPSAAVDREFSKSRRGWSGLADPYRDRQQKADIAKRLGIGNEYGSNQRKQYLDSLSGFKDPAVRQKFADMAGPDPMAAQQAQPQTPGLRRGGRARRKADGGMMDQTNPMTPNSPVNPAPQAAQPMQKPKKTFGGSFWSPQQLSDMRDQMQAWHKAHPNSLQESIAAEAARPKPKRIGTRFVNHGFYSSPEPIYENTGPFGKLFNKGFNKGGRVQRLKDLCRY